MGHRQKVLLSLAALMLCAVSADALRQLHQSEVKVCRYACGMGMSCINGACLTTSVKDLSSGSSASSAEAASPAPTDSESMVKGSPSNAAAQMSPVPLESNSEGESVEDRLNAEKAASLSFIDTSADTSTITISIAPSTSPKTGVVSVVVVEPVRKDQSPVVVEPVRAEQSPVVVAEPVQAQQSPSPAPPDMSSPAS